MRTTKKTAGSWKFQKPVRGGTAVSIKVFGDAAKVPLAPALAMDLGEGSKQSHPTDASRGLLPVRLILQRCIGVRRKLLVSIPVQMVTRLYAGFQDLPRVVTSLFTFCGQQ